MNPLLFRFAFVVLVCVAAIFVDGFGVFLNFPFVLLTICVAFVYYWWGGQRMRR